MCREVYNETKAEGFLSVFAVALLAEGVDRNTIVQQQDDWGKVALLAEGVDRNATACVLIVGLGQSPSSRRAWIEISTPREKRPGWS